MTMTPFFRKLTLTTHITFSVGWFGAVVGFLALAIAGLTSQDAQMVRSAYLTMELIGWFVIVPFCIASFLSGLIQSLGTQWGLFKHYWVLAKLLLTIAATIILFLHMKPISYIAGIASQTTLSNPELLGLQIQLIADAGAALLVLLVATMLSVYKPWGRSRYGLRKQLEQNKQVTVRESIKRKSWVFYLLLGLIALVILMFIVLHLTGGGLGNH